MGWMGVPTALTVTCAPVHTHTCAESTAVRSRRPVCPLPGLRNEVTGTSEAPVCPVQISFLSSLFPRHRTTVGFMSPRRCGVSVPPAPAGPGDPSLSPGTGVRGPVGEPSQHGVRLREASRGARRAARPPGRCAGEMVASRRADTGLGLGCRRSRSLRSWGQLRPAVPPRVCWECGSRRAFRPDRHVGAEASRPL